MQITVPAMTSAGFAKKTQGTDGEREQRADKLTMSFSPTGQRGAGNTVLLSTGLEPKQGITLLENMAYVPALVQHIVHHRFTLKDSDSLHQGRVCFSMK